MSEARDGGPALDGQPSTGIASTASSEIAARLPVSLRDYFAGQVMASMFASEACQSQLEAAIIEMHRHAPEGDRRKIAREIIAERAYLQADALLAQRAKGQP